jgi:outer membrane cobalamin receptor
MKKHLILTTFFSLLSILCFAQASTITGAVKDAETGEGLIAAYITFGDKGVTTDIDGSFSIQLNAGEYIVQCTYLGYAQYVEAIKVLEGQDTNIELLLQPEAKILETATVTSSRFEKPLSEVTVSLEVLQPRLIENTNATSVDEALERIPGLTISDGQADIRGGSGWSYGAGSRVLLLVDNIPALVPDAGIPQWDDMPVENIAQVEVIKGAASALYGSSALNGIINIRTAYAKSEPITKVALFGTSYMAPSVREKKWWDSNNMPYEAGVSFSHSQKFKKLDLVLGAYGLTRNSFNRETTTDYGRINTSLRYRFSDDLVLQLNANFNEGSSSDFFYWRAPEADEELTGFYEGDEGAASQTDRTRFFIDPSLTYFDKSGNQHRINSRFYYVDNRSDNAQAQTAQLYYGEYQFQRRFENVGLNLTTGLVGMHTASQSELYSDTTFSINNLAAYLQLDKKIGDRLNLSAGFRFEQNTINSPDSVLVGFELAPTESGSESKPVFRAGANYQAGEGTFFRASWGQGYRFPTLAEKFINTNAGGIIVTPNPELQSETGWSAEIGLKQGFRISNWEGFIDVAGFWTEYRDMMEFTFDGNVFAFQSQNIGNTEIKGVDVTLAGRGRIGKINVNLYAGYNYIDPKFKEFEVYQFGDPNVDPRNLNEGQRNFRNTTADFNILKYRRKHNAKFDIEGLYGRWLLGFTGNYGSHIEAIDPFLAALNEIRAYREQNNKGFRTLDMRLAHRFTEMLKVSFLMRNIFNEEYTRRPGLLEAPRNWTVRVDVKL